MLEEDADYNRVRGEIRLICNELDVFNMSSDRWLDACCRTVDQITHFSRHQKFRRYWNERDYSAEGRVFFAYLKSIVADAGGNVRARYKADHGATGETQYITDCYHLSDGEDSCVSCHHSRVNRNLIALQDEDTEQIRRHSRAARVAAGTRLQRAVSCKTPHRDSD